MGQTASVSKDAVVQMAKNKTNYLPPLGPPNQVCTLLHVRALPFHAITLQQRNRS